MTRNSIPGAGIEPAPLDEGRDFKPLPSPLPDNDLAAPPSAPVSAVVGEDRPVSAPVATDPATGRGDPGPLQKACRDAGLPFHPDSLMYLEALAHRLNLVPKGKEVTRLALRQAARHHRKILQSGARRVAADAKMSRTQARKIVKAAHGIETGRQWRIFKKREQRALRAEQRAAKGEV